MLGCAKAAIDAVPESYYEGSLALGATHERSIFHVMVPAARSGIFAGIVLGGFGSVKGAIVGCILIGLIESFSILITDSYRDAIVFFVLIVVLVIRPTGIFGEKIQEKA